MNDLILASVAYASGSPHAQTFLEAGKRRTEERHSDGGAQRRWRLSHLFLRRRNREARPLAGHSAWA